MAQVEALKSDGGEPPPVFHPGGKAARQAAAEYWATAPIRWEFPSAPAPALTFSTAGPLDLLFGAPDTLVGGAMHALSGLSHDAGVFDMREESRRSMSARLTGAIDIGTIDRPFATFMNLLYDRESKYFSRWQESMLSTVSFEEGDEDLDGDLFLREQSKVFVHALGRRYLGRYGDYLGDSLRREAFDVSRWESSDFVVGPAVIAGYLYLRGWDGRIKLGEVDCRIHVLPLERIEGHLHKANDILVSAASLEFAFPNFPLRAIVSCGVVDGQPTLDFIGLGTSIGMVRKAIKLEFDPEDLDR
jgi:hypothetical protein